MSDYRGHRGHHHHKKHHCGCDQVKAEHGRFCRNVCDQFSSGRDQCYEDCMDCGHCENNKEEEKGTQNGWICCKPMDVEECNEYKGKQDHSCNCW